MSSKDGPKLKSLRQLHKVNDVLRHRERDLVLGRKVDIGKLRAMLWSFLKDCRRKMEDKRLGNKSRQKLKNYLLHWQLMDKELEKGRAGTLFPVPKRIPTRAGTPLPEPSASRAPSGYQSPTGIIREKANWPALLRPSETRLFNLDELPCFPPASLLRNAD